ncbi:MAG TPA: DUF2336 domain-containing protein [Alphaproteobacteria bacterium]
MALTARDVEELSRDRGPTARRRVIGEVGRAYANGALSPRARREALAIARVVLDDVEVVVRQAMAEALCRAPDLPRDLALALAKDVFEVARPILEISRALSDDDLIELIRDPVSRALRARLGLSGEDALAVEAERRRIAVARRQTVSERVAQALIEEGTATVAATVLANRGATIGEPAIHLAVKRFGTDQGVQSALVDRATLPVTVVERLMYLVSEGLRASLEQRHTVSPRVLAAIARQVREKATLDLLKGDDGEVRGDRLVAGLERQGRLTPTLILRAVCTGKIQFAESALAQVTDLPIDAVRSRLRHGSALDVRDLARRAGLPAHFAPVIESLFRRAYVLCGDPSAGSRQWFTEQMTLALVETVGRDAERTRDAGADELDYVLAELERTRAKEAAAR